MLKARVTRFVGLERMLAKALSTVLIIIPFFSKSLFLSRRASPNIKVYRFSLIIRSDLLVSLFTRLLYVTKLFYVFVTKVL